MRVSIRRVRYANPVQSCYPGSEHMQEPGNVSTESPLVCEHIPILPRRRPSKINRRHFSTPFASYCAGVMQDKGLPNFVARICTSLPIPPVTCWHDMYSIYIFLLQYIANLHMHLLY